MFLMHAIYGFGATVSPLVSTEFVKQLRSTVYYYFAVSLGLALFTAFTLFAVFRLRTEDQIVGRRVPESTSSADSVNIPTGESIGEKRDREVQERRDAGSSGNKMKRIMKTPAVHFMAFYIMIYVGVEVTIGGWAVSIDDVLYGLS
jgi:fucose permease